MLGVYLRKDEWHIDRDKLLQRRAGVLARFEKYANTRDERHIKRAIRRIGGFLAHYQQIPGIAAKEVNALRRWYLRKWNATCTDCPEKYRRRFLRTVNP